jgi:hypothetical protein
MAEILEIPEAAIRARQMYADGAVVATIRAATKLNLDRLYYWINGGNGRLPALPHRRLLGQGFGRRSRRASMIARMMRVAEKQLFEIEQRLAAPGIKPAETERSNRDLAVLSRTMRELTALDAFHRSQELLREQNQTNDDPVPRNVDELRESLLRKMDALIAGQSENPGHGPVA